MRGENRLMSADAKSRGEVARSDRCWNQVFTQFQRRPLPKRQTAVPGSCVCEGAPEDRVSERNTERRMKTRIRKERKRESEKEDTTLKRKRMKERMYHLQLLPLLPLAPRFSTSCRCRKQRNRSRRHATTTTPEQSEFFFSLALSLLSLSSPDGTV